MANLEFEQLLKKLKTNKRIIIQAHDFPDHDAISSAFALAYLLKELGHNPYITYQGYIDRISLKNMINLLSIPVIETHLLNLQPDDKIIIVDGCIGEKNITDLPGLEVGVIDHHNVTAPDFVWYSDIRSNYGSTATIMVEYFKYFKISIPTDIATALLVGLSFDTANFTRAVSPQDLQALFTLQSKANTDLVHRICRNQIELDELMLFESLISTMKREGNAAFSSLPKGCSKNMLGVLGDFLLSVHEIDIVVLSAQCNERTYLSLRSECNKNNVEKIIRNTLNDSGIGFGGGHSHMAGGVLNSSSLRCNSVEYIYDLFKPNLVLS
jgi:nanoRNase/pAp phosphatase (c-di-AMP/oligoRNAs hydrolase)